MKKHGISFFSCIHFFLVWLALYLDTDAIFRYALRTGVPALASLTAILLSCLLLYSLSRLLIRFEHKKQLYEGKKSTREKISFLLHRTKTRIAFLLFLFLPVPTPMFAVLFGNLSPFLLYLSSRAILPLYLLAFVLGSVSGLSYREKNDAKGKKAPFFFPFRVLFFALLYFVGGVALPYFIMVCFSLPGIALMLITSSLGGALLVIFGTLWLVRILRALSIRRAFLEKLQDACKEAKFPLPELKRPILSLFRGAQGTRFTLVTAGEIYECKVFGTFRPNLIHRFYANGTGARVHVFVFRPFALRTTYFRNLTQERHELWESRFSYGFEAEAGVKKMVIFNPCSKIVDGNNEGHGFSLDNGLCIGEYKFFTASGFCNALARGCLDK